MFRRLRKPITTKQTMRIVSLVNKTKKFLAVLGMLGIIWSSGPMQYINAMTNQNQPQETILMDENYPVDGLSYPTTTDEDFDPSQVEIQMEVVTERTETTKTFKKIDGTYETAVYNEVIHYLENGVYKQIDNSLINLGDMLENKSNKFKLQFPKKLDNNKEIKLTMDGYSIDWSVLNISKSDVEYDDTELTPNNIKELVNINQSILYPNVRSGVDIEYVLTGSQVKENIILESYKSDFSMTFEYKLKDLSLTEDAEGNIVFVNDSNEIVFLFNDLVMFDNDLNESYNIEYDLVETGNRTYEITIRPNDEWLQTASYPVVIDPSITYYHYEGLVRDKYVYGSTGAVDNQYIKVGDNGSWNYRSYLEIDMSVLPGDVQVTYAHLTMQTYTNYNNCTNDCTIIVKEVLPQYSFDSIKGQGLNITDDRIIDYEIINSEDSDTTNYYWDISRNLQEWAFSGDTTRVLEFSRNDETQAGYIFFQSSNQAGIGPAVEVGFQYLGGVKDFWTYNEQPIGPAGTGFVSDYTGHLNFARQDLSYNTELQNLELSFVYNTSMKQHDVGYGQGWLTNYNIQAQWDSDAGQFYTVDATGGKVWYIRNEENLSDTCDERFTDMIDTYCYLAEDGSRNMLVVTYIDRGGYELDKEIMLVTLDQIYYEFNGLGLLSKIRDEKHNTEITIDSDVVVLLGGGGYQARVNSITDSTGNYIELSYTSGILDKAELYVKTSSTPTFNLLKYTEYEFDTTSNPGENLLDEVTYNVDYSDDGVYEVEHKADYDYDSGNKLTKAETIYIDEQQQLVYAGKVVYTYTSNKVLTISSFYNGSEFGNVTYDYDYRKTTITNHLGEEIYYFFDVYGHTIQVMNDDGLLQSFKYLNIFSNTEYDTTYEGYYYYLRNYRLNHQLVYKSDPEISFLDPILNGSFEGSTSNDGWTLGIDAMGGATDMGYATHQYTTSEFVYGDQSARLYYYDNSMESHLKQIITVDPGTYKLQGYVKNNGTSSSAYLKVEGASYEGGNSSNVPNDGEWHYIELTFGATSVNQQITIKLMNAAHGSVYFDSMQVVEGFRNSRTNLFNNSSFESALSGWSLYGAYKSDYNFTTESIYSEILGNSGLRIDGDQYDVNGASMDITSIVGTTEGDIYTVNLWGYSMGTPYKKHSDDGNSSTFDQESYMRGTITYRDASNNIVADPTYITFDQQIEGWQKLSAEIHIPAGVTQVQLYLEYIGLGYVVYDGLTIEKALSGTSYLLNEAGNIEQITTSNSEVTTINHEEDTNGKPVSSTPSSINTVHNNTEIPLNDDFLPEYYENNNVRVTPTYDSNGRTTVEKYGDNVNYFTTSTTFDTGTFSQFKEKTTNEFGKSTNYDYDIVTGLLQSIQNANGDTIEYEYYDDGLLHKVKNNGYCDEDNPTECAYTEYVYDDSNRLIKIIMESGYYYLIDYDAEGRMEEVFIKNDNTSYSNSLMSYLYYQEGSSNEYETNKINIQTYGNGDLIKFIYDDENRVKQVQYNNSVGVPVTRFSYEYDQRGQIAVFNTHNTSGSIIETEYYTYDISGKLLSVTDNEGNRIEYKYDNEGNLSKLEFDILGKTQTVNYDHNEALHIDRDILDEQIFGNYNIQAGVIYVSDSDHEYDLGTTSVKINTVSSEPSFGGAIEVMPSSSYTVKMNVVSTTNSIRLQVAEYSDNPFETGNYYTTRYDTYSSATGLRDLTFTTGANTKYIIVSAYSGYTADFTFDSLTFDFDGLDETALYDQTTYTTQDLQNVVRDYEYEENALSRLDFINLQNGTFSIDQDYIYDGNTTRISEIEYRIDGNNDGIVDDKLEYVYNYDDLGNIEKVYYILNGSTKTYEYYEYDEMNQLALEDHKDYTVSCTSLSDTCYTKIYKYDLRGNITDIKIYPYGERETKMTYDIPEFEWSYSGNDIEVWGTWGTHDDIYNLVIGTSPNTSPTFVDYDYYILSDSTTLLESTLDIYTDGYYYNRYRSIVDGNTIYWKIVFKVGSPMQVEVNNYPTQHIKYNYSTDWMDQLVNYETMTYNSNGTIATQTTEQSYTFDDQGNPTNITNFMYNDTKYDHAILDYEGRQLKEIKIYNSSQVLVDTLTYTYNDQGYRTSKTVNGVTTEYHLQGDKVLLETDGTYAIIYTYDYDGKLISFNYDSNKNDTTKGIEYYYIRNQQGDITKIVDKNGSIVVEYMYDAWGEQLEIDGSLASTIGEINPYRYRGYRYDEEIDMYYLNSRFYDANVGRFINADALLGEMGSIQGHNMFAYGNNNPIMMIDPSGYAPEWWNRFKKKVKNAWNGVTDTVDSAVKKVKEVVDTISDKVSDTVDSTIESVGDWLEKAQMNVKEWWEAEQAEVMWSMTFASIWMKYAIPAGAFVSSVTVGGILTGLAITAGVFVVAVVVIYVVIKGVQYLTEDPHPIPE